MESTAARRPPANDEGVCGMFINLFRRQRPALARLARNSNAYRQPMVASVSSSAVGVSSITSESNTATAAGVSTLDATIGRIHDIPQSAMSRLTGSPHRIRAVDHQSASPAAPRQRGGDGWAQKLGSMIQLKVSNTAKNRTLTAE